jgi:hypothetical protein
MPSEMQLTTTGTKMTEEEHVVTAETHLRYVEGHLQPSEEHLADAEVHLKLVKAHLAMLEPAEQNEVNFLTTKLDPMRKQTTITHEAAVRAGETFHSFYLLFVRIEASEVGSLAAAGADAIV